MCKSLGIYLKPKDEIKSAVLLTQHTLNFSFNIFGNDLTKPILHEKESFGSKQSLYWPRSFLKEIIRTTKNIFRETNLQKNSEDNMHYTFIH